MSHTTRNPIIRISSLKWQKTVIPIPHMVKNGNAFVKNPANFFTRFHFPENNRFLWFSLPSVTIHYHKRLFNSQNNLYLIYRNSAILSSIVKRHQFKTIKKINLDVKNYKTFYPKSLS